MFKRKKNTKEKKEKKERQKTRNSEHHKKLWKIIEEIDSRIHAEQERMNKYGELIPKKCYEAEILKTGERDTYLKKIDEIELIAGQFLKCAKTEEELRVRLKRIAKKFNKTDDGTVKATISKSRFNEKATKHNIKRTKRILKKILKFKKKKKQ